MANYELLKYRTLKEEGDMGIREVEQPQKENTTNLSTGALKETFSIQRRQHLLDIDWPSYSSWVQNSEVAEGGQVRNRQLPEHAKGTPRSLLIDAYDQLIYNYNFLSSSLAHRSL